ncbi:DUF2141 domain-containing protein [Sphingomonas antarctica]|uniref:DUF2141 domain-containing protein n=1 Tax=Sphingomonas antarctica TaxID=2040274 RepID=UPI0039EAF256
MKAAAFLVPVALSGTAALALPSTPALGLAEGHCAPAETGPSFLVTVLGLKDRTGRLRLELYPDNDQDFLADDNMLVAAHKAFARVDVAVPPSGPVSLCIRAPRTGYYALSLLHDRNGDHKFTLSTDGVGFPNNPPIGWSRPKAAVARVMARTGPTPLQIRMNYRRGLFSFGPIAGSGQ